MSIEIGETLSPYALTNLSVARAYLKRETEEQDSLITFLINRVSSQIDVYCWRKLLARPYTGLIDPAVTYLPPLRVNGLGTHEIILPEWPVISLLEVRAVNADASFDDPIDLTEWSEPASGVLHFPNATLPKGTKNVQVKGTVGYTVSTHPADVRALEYACLRLLQVAWQDWDAGTGRGTGFSVSGASVNLVDEAIPKDVQEILRPYQRMM